MHTSTPGYYYFSLTELLSSQFTLTVEIRNMAGAPAGFFAAGGGAKPGTTAPTFFCYVWTPCCIPDY